MSKIGWANAFLKTYYDIAGYAGVAEHLSKVVEVKGDANEQILKENIWNHRLGLTFILELIGDLQLTVGCPDDIKDSLQKLDSDIKTFLKNYEGDDIRAVAKLVVGKRGATAVQNGIKDLYVRTVNKVYL